MILEGTESGGLTDGGEVFVFGEEAHGVDTNVAIGVGDEFAQCFLVEGVETLERPEGVDDFGAGGDQPRWLDHHRADPTGDARLRAVG